MNKLLATLLVFSCVSYSNFEKNHQIYTNYCKALDNYSSTYQNYVVVTIQDKASGTAYEVCITGFELVSTMMDAWHFDLEDEFKAVRKIKRHKNRTFKVENVDSHPLLNSVKYTASDLLSFANRVQFDSIANSISNKNKWHYFASNEKEHIMMAHLLFKEGYLTGINECFGGDQLEYYAEDY